MRRFVLNSDLEADCVEGENSRAGEVYRVDRNKAGGTNLTPIARYFVWRPAYVEGFNPHWRVDCFVRRHELSPDAESLGRLLTESLLTNDLCAEPIWTSWHTSEEVGGTALGEVFELD